MLQKCHAGLQFIMFMDLVEHSVAQVTCGTPQCLCEIKLYNL
jgi:hypothetical protein